MAASRLYHDDAHRKRIIKACLTLDAPLPVKVLRWQGKQYWAYQKSPILYYLDADGQLNRLDTYKRKLRHQLVTKETVGTELDSHAIRIAADTNPVVVEAGKREIQMDQEFNTWIVENGTRKPISCREICEQFKDGSIITRLRTGIDSGADISMVEI